ncbi:MAG TPA: cupin domain-containing protein [Mycobacterium sp.]|nr:cupin domain-containing protein [Mycobacterium sp.]
MNARNAAMEISPADSRSAAAGPAETFTGEVSVTPLFNPNAFRTFGAASVTFSACARTAWHSHPGGQTLVVTAGSGWVQERGRRKQAIKPGDVIWTPPGVEHWHGGTESTTMTHIAIQETVDGRPVDWLEHVTDEDYLR